MEKNIRKTVKLIQQRQIESVQKETKRLDEIGWFLADKLDENGDECGYETLKKLLYHIEKLTDLAVHQYEVIESNDELIDYLISEYE